MATFPGLVWGKQSTRLSANAKTGHPNPLFTLYFKAGLSRIPCRHGFAELLRQASRSEIIKDITFWGMCYFKYTLIGYQSDCKPYIFNT